MEPINKQFKNDGIDRISELPDEVLHKILSYVPTKNAMSTSVLSTRWKNLFPIFVNPVKLDFNDSLFLNPRENVPDFVFTYFVTFVDNIMNETLLDGPDVDTMILKCAHSYGDDKITLWVSSAMRLKLRKLKLGVCIHDSERFFQSLNGCLTLVRLEISHKFVLVISDEVEFRLPNVKELGLVNLIFADEEGEFEGSVERLIHGCLALEDLRIMRCDFKDVGYMFIETQELKHLTIRDSWNDSSCDLSISTMNLETLHFSGCAPKSFLYNHFMASLSKAYIDLGPNQRVIEEYGGVEDDNEDGEDICYQTCVAKVIIACSAADYLYISARSLMALKLTHMKLPKFEYLEWLLLGWIGRDEWAVLAYFLQNAPNLETLILQGGFIEPTGGYAIFDTHVRSLCLGLKLKEIDYWYFNNEEDEIKLLNYFLHQGQCLEILKLHWRPCRESGNLSERLKLPRNCVCSWTNIVNGVQISIRRSD